MYFLYPSDAIANSGGLKTDTLTDIYLLDYGAYKFLPYWNMVYCAQAGEMYYVTVSNSSKKLYVYAKYLTGSGSKGWNYDSTARSFGDNNVMISRLDVLYS